MSEYVTLPREPTTAMTEAVHKAINDAQKAGWFGLHPIEIYRTYLAAAPAPQGIGRDSRDYNAILELREQVELGGPHCNVVAIQRWAADRILALLPTEPPAQGEG